MNEFTDRFLSTLAEDKFTARKQLQLSVCDQRQDRILQIVLKTTSVLHLLYTDTVLTLKNTLLQHSVQLTIHTVCNLITESQLQSSDVHFTFGTLFHQSLESPKRPLALTTEDRTPAGPLVSRKSRKHPTRCGRKTLICKSKTYPTYGTQEDPTPTQSPHFSFESTGVSHHPRWNTRRHSITAHNSPSQLPIASATHIHLSRHYSIGLVSPDKCRGPTFPATIMYAKIVSHLEENLESGRHYHHLQPHRNCFCGQSMVNCLLAHCITSLSTCVTKEKAVDMCRRMLSHGVIANVSHKKQQDTEGMVFKCSRLYRFTGNHFWELDGGTTSSSMLSLDLSPEKKPRRPSIKKMYTTFTESKTGFVRKCKSRFSLREANTI